MASLHIHHRGELLDVVWLQQVVHLLAQVLAQWRGIGIGVEEDEAGERVDGHLEQRVLGLVDLADEVFPQHSAQLALQVVGPKVVLAEEAALGVPGLGDAQRVSAVPAGVDEAAKLRRPFRGR